MWLIIKLVVEYKLFLQNIILIFVYLLVIIVYILQKSLIFKLLVTKKQLYKNIYIVFVFQKTVLILIYFYFILNLGLYFTILFLTF